MPLTWEDVVAAPAPPGASKNLPAGAISADEMFGGAPPAPAAKQPSLLGDVKSLPSKYWEDYVKLSNEYASALKSDVEANPKGLAEQVIHSGKTLLDALGSAFSPLESVARTTIVDPVKAAVNKMSNLAQEHLAAPDVYDPQKRREAWLLGQPVKQQYPGGVDLHIHQADVARTAEGLNRFMETGVLTATGFIGGKSAVPRAVTAEIGESTLPLRNMVRVAPEVAASALGGLKELSIGALAKFPGLKDSVERLTGNIKDLAIREPQTVEALAAHVAKADPDLGAQIQKLGMEAQELPPAAQEALGEQLAKPQVEPRDYDAMRVGEIEPDGAHFSESGMSTYSDPNVEGAKFYRYSPDIKIADMGEAKTAEEVLSKALEIEKDPEAVARIQKLLKEAKTGRDPAIGHIEVEELGLNKAAKDSGYHGMRFWENDDVGGPTTVNVWDLSKVAEITGKTASGKLRLRPVGPDLARTMAEGYQALKAPASTPKEVVEAANKAYIEQLLREESSRTGEVLHLDQPPSTPPLSARDRLAQRMFKQEPLDLSKPSGISVREGRDTDLEAYSPNGLTQAMRRGTDRLQITDTKTRPGAQGGGEGTARIIKLFETAKSEGRHLVSDTQVSPAAVKVYDRLEKLGYKVQRNTHQIDQAGNLISDSTRPVFEVLEGPKAPLDQTQVFKAGFDLNSIPGMPVVMGKLKAYWEQILQTVSVESFGREAKAAAAVIAKRIAIQMQRDSMFTHQARMRRAFWDSNPGLIKNFLQKFEKGQSLGTKALDQVALFYRVWNERIYNQDLKNGFDYEPVDNYLYHTFEDSEGAAAFFTQRYGSKWNNPAFMKSRGFEMYDAAVASGLKPRFTNPEDIMLARQHASDVAEMRVNVLKDLEGFGLARKVVKGQGQPAGFLSTEWRAPNGQRYWVHQTADRVMQNAFNTKSLWTMPGIGGDAFRGAMWLKNTIVPIKLALSLFHPIHVATIDNATGMVRASKELLSGTMSPGQWMKEMTKSALYADFFSAPRVGSRILKAYQGKIQNLTSDDVESMRLMSEGGFIPEMSSQYRTQATEKFMRAVRQRSLTAAWHLPFAAIDALQKPMFQIWIPSLKIASYLKDARTAFRTDPTLLQDSLKRQIALRKIAKSVDNRYGEMAYNTLFWNRWVKDLMVANTLSLGWQMGFIREYGGGALDLGQFLKPGSPVQKIKEGALDRPMFVTFYTTQALAYGGLMTWAFTGQTPQDLMDYIYPKNGEQNPDGTPQRVTTMFYPREFAAIYKHMENEGVVRGLGHLAQNKASGVIGLTSEWASGVNSFGQEIRDPNAPAYKQLEQTLAHTLGALEPISLGAIRQQVTESPVKSTLMNVAGFSPAPKYITESRTEGAIKQLYQKYLAPKQTPFERAEYSEDARLLRRYWDQGDSEKFGDLMDKMQDKYELTGQELRRLTIKLQRGSDPMTGMFSRLTWQQQKRLLDQMTEQEREVYLPHSNRQHLRFNYEPPEEQR